MGKEKGQPLAVGTGRCLRWRCVLPSCSACCCCICCTCCACCACCACCNSFCGVGCISSCSASIAFFFFFLLWRASCASSLALLLHLTPKSVQTTGTPWCHRIEGAGGIADLSAAQRVQARFRSFRRSICTEKSRQPRGHFEGSEAKNGRFRQQVDDWRDQQQRI